MYGEAGAMAQNNATSKADKAESRATIQAAAAALKDSAMDVDPADYTEDFNPFMPTSVVTRKAQYSPAAGKDRILTPIQCLFKYVHFSSLYVIIRKVEIMRRLNPSFSFTFAPFLLCFDVFFLNIA